MRPFRTPPPLPTKKPTPEAYLASQEQELGRLVQKGESIAGAVYQVLKKGGYDVQRLHRQGKMRNILGMFY